MAHPSGKGMTTEDAKTPIDAAAHAQLAKLVAMLSKAAPDTVSAHNLYGSQSYWDRRFEASATSEDWCVRK